MFADQNLLRFDALCYKLKTTARTSSNYSSVKFQYDQAAKNDPQKDSRTCAHFAVNGSLNSHPQMEILQVNRTTSKTFEPTATKKTPLNCFNMRN